MDPSAELASLNTSLDELTARVTAMAERADATTGEEDLASDLFEVERSLRAATRRLSAARRR